MNQILNRVDSDTKETLIFMKTAMVYNKATGSNITHKDVAQWGIIEAAKISSALEVWELF